MSRRHHGGRRVDPAADHAAEQAQPPLIPMSREEMDEAARDLAQDVAVLEEMERSHAEARKAMRQEREAVMARIASTASTIRSQGR